MRKQSELFFKVKTLQLFLVLLLFGAGIAIRIYDLTDPPLDFHPARQYHSAIISRGLYTRWGGDYPDWQANLNIAQESSELRIEPPIFEYLTAFTYKLTGSDSLWIPRLYAILFWTLGGIPLFLISKKWNGYVAALIALSFYLVNPYGIIASRAFQPDPIMISSSIFAVWAVDQWLDQRTWRWTLFAGLGMGVAILLKQVAVFWLFFTAAFTLLAIPLKDLIRDKKIWVMAVFAALPAAIYNVYGIFFQKTLIGQYSQRFFPHLWIEPGFYLQWVDKIGKTVGLPFFLLALVGIFLYKAKLRRRVLLGYTFGYLVYGFVFSHHIATHDYYQLPLFPLTALGLAPIALSILEKIKEANKDAWRVVPVVLIFLSGIVLSLWEARSTMKKADYRSEVEFLASVSQQMGGPGTPTVGLMEDYGAALSYYGYILPSYWWPEENGRPVRALAGEDFLQVFNRRTEGKKYFIITDFDELRAQPSLNQALENFSTIVDNGRYQIFDLNSKLKD